MSSKVYVAMGDSVAAGVGLQDDSDSSACDRTNQSYPNLVTAARNYKLYNIACSAATLPAGILGEQDVNNLQVASQMQQLTAHAKPGIITLTIGANDIQWTTILAKCYTSVCGTDSDNAAANAKLQQVSSNLGSVLSQIQSIYGSSVPPILVSGYHQVFPENGASRCADLDGIDASELSWGRQLQIKLNDTLRQVVKSYAFATFVTVDFSGHELCTSDPWVEGIADKRPYHPTQAGQSVYANAMISNIKVL